MRGTFYMLMAILAFNAMPGDANANTVLGSISCKQWQDRQNKPADAQAYTIWLNGYLSGANAQYGDMLGRDFIKNSDKISIVDWTDVYCKKHPESQLEDSTNALIKLLIKDLPF